MDADRIFVVTNNHFQGKAVVNAIQLMRALGMEAEPPAPLKAAYPDLL